MTLFSKVVASVFVLVAMAHQGAEPSRVGAGDAVCPGRPPVSVELWRLDGDQWAQRPDGQVLSLDEGCVVFER